MPTKKKAPAKAAKKSVKKPAAKPAFKKATKVATKTTKPLFTQEDLEAIAKALLSINTDLQRKVMKVLRDPNVGTPPPVRNPGADSSN